MKTKKYLHVTVETHSGTTYTNHLKLSEAHFISQITQENKRVVVSLGEETPERYKVIFG